MRFRYDIRVADSARRQVRRFRFAPLAAAGIALAPAWGLAETLDFGAALQALDAGETVTQVTLENGASMTVWAENHGSGPDKCIVFDSSHPTGGDVDLGTPNEDFGGPGKGNGGEQGKEGENAVALGKLLVISGNDEDANDDGRMDDPEDESDGGLLTLHFSHAGRLSFKVVDVDKDEDEPHFTLYKEGHEVGQAQGDEFGNNGVQPIDLSSFGDIDAIEMHLHSSVGIAAIQLDVVTVGTLPRTWSNVKSTYR
jgi:hypothetical protein